jgi:hypothetical protein
MLKVVFARGRSATNEERGGGGYKYPPPKTSCYCAGNLIIRTSGVRSELLITAGNWNRGGISVDLGSELLMVTENQPERLYEHFRCRVGTFDECWPFPKKINLCTCRLCVSSRFLGHLKTTLLASQDFQFTSPFYSTVFPILNFEIKKNLNPQWALTSKKQVGGLLLVKAYFSFALILHTS